jgi:hypothetical protein
MLKSGRPDLSGEADAATYGETLSSVSRSNGKSISRNTAAP